MKHPKSFRFSIGQRVLFNPYLAIAAQKSMTDLTFDTWCEGEIADIDIMGRKNEDYFSYECSFGSSGKLKCFITKDDDEHITTIVDADPRDRLFEAISQDCTPYHLEYLVNFYSMDVLMFRDLVVDKAIEFGSYNVRGDTCVGFL